MALSNGRKASVGVLALALSALALDRFVLGGGGPQPALAQGLPAVGEPGGTPAGPAGRNPGSTLSVRFERLAQGEELDPLSVPDVFNAETWRLSALVGTGVKGGVIIDDTLVAVGQEYRGARLKAVSKDGAEFLRNGRSFMVTLERPEGAKDR